MYQSVVLYIGLRYACGQKKDRFGSFVSWVSTIGIALGVMALVTVLSVMNGFEHELTTSILKFMPQAIITNPEGRINPKDISVSIPESFMNVKKVTPLTTGDVILQSKYSLAMGVMLGINPVDPEPLSSYIIDAHQHELTEGKYRIILGNTLAIQLGIKPKDTVRLVVPGNCQFTPIGCIPSQRLFIVIGTFISNSKVDDYQLLINQQDASHLMNYPNGYITGWRLWLKKPLEVNKTQSLMKMNGLVWHDWREREGELFQAISMEKKMMSLLLGLIVIVASFNIITPLGLYVMEKRSEIAILKTQGMQRWQIMMIFIIQGASSGVLGVLFGTGLGLLLTTQLNSVIPVTNKLFDIAQSLPVFIKPMQVIIISISTITIALISTIYPSYCASNTNPAEALRYE